MLLYHLKSEYATADAGPLRILAIKFHKWKKKLSLSSGTSEMFGGC